MSAATEKAFEKIAHECSVKAARVDCSIREHATGLKHVIEYLKECLALAESEAKAEDRNSNG